MKTTLLASLLAGFALLVPSVHAQTTVMDQIGPTGSFFTGDNVSGSQNFTDIPNYNVATVDDFTVQHPTTLTNISAAMLGYNGATTFANFTGYDVNIYSSVAAANSSLIGDVFHVTIPRALAVVTTPFSGDNVSALVSLNTSITLTTAGTYYVSVLADGTFATDRQAGVYISSGVAGFNPGGLNAFEENPGGGFGMTDPVPQNLDAAYRIIGFSIVPEPGTWALLGVGGAGALALAALRRRVRAA